MPAIEDKFLKPPVRFPPNLVVSRWLDYAELPHGPEQVCSPQSSAMRHNPTYGIMAVIYADTRHKTHWTGRAMAAATGVSLGSVQRI
jgi:hypothetical protein